MLPKVILLVCLVPLALGSREEMMEMMMKEMMGGRGIGEQKSGDMGDIFSKIVGKMGDMGGKSEGGDIGDILDKIGGIFGKKDRHGNDMGDMLENLIKGMMGEGSMGKKDHHGSNMGGMWSKISGKMSDIVEKMGEMWDQKGDMGGTFEGFKGHFKRDGDCNSEEEATEKNNVMFKMFNEIRKRHEMNEKKHELAEKMEKLNMFKKFLAFAHKKKKEEKGAIEQKKMFEMFQNFQMMHKKNKKEDEFKDLIETFEDKKHKFAFAIAHHFLSFCMCGEIDYQMNKMFVGNNMTNGTDLMDNMADESTFKDWMSGDMDRLTEKVEKMSPEEVKKLYMTGLIKSMCRSAKTFINHAKQFEDKFMKGDHSKVPESSETNITRRPTTPITGGDHSRRPKPTMS